MEETIVRSAAEIRRVLGWASDGVQEGSHFTGMKYEEGLQDMYDWLVGNTDDAPDRQE